MSSEFIDTNKYCVFRCDRDYLSCGLKRGGGVCLAVDSSLSPVNLDVKNCTDFKEFPLIDIVGVRIRTNHFSCFIFVIYIPPSIPARLYTSVFDILSSLNYFLDGNILIIGDFNIPEYVKFLETGDLSVPVTAVNNFCQLFSLNQFNHVKNVNQRILDLVLSNLKCSVQSSIEYLVPIDLHHPPLYILFKATLPSLGNKQKSSSTFYNYKKADLVSLYQHIGLTDWSFLNELDDVDQAFHSFYQVLYALLDEYVPLVKSTNRLYPPWFNSALISKIRKKSKLFKNYKSNLNPLILDDFKRLRSNIKFESQQCYRSYCRALEDKIKEEPSRFWHFVNKKRGNSGYPNIMTYEGNEYKDLAEISEAFAAHFKNSYSDHSQPISTLYEHSNGSIPLTLSCNEFSFEDIEMALKKIKPKFTMGPDKIPAFLVHDCASVLAHPLRILYNLSLKRSVFPNVLKESRIVPIHKHGDLHNIENFRPITVINNFSKVLEIALYIPIFEHVRHMITEKQHGFMKRRSTATNLFCITQFICNAFDEHKQVDVIYTDFSKAFDKLDHSILLRKLDDFGFDYKLCTFLRTYLENRTQFVDCKGFHSNIFVATSGVPQGSILGPLFFNIFVNDIGDNLDVDHLMYADDLKIYSIINESTDSQILQLALEQIQKWCFENRLVLNISKCNVVSYSLKNDFNIVKYPYSLNSTLLNRSSTFRDLGVTFDNKLSFIPHIQNLCSATYKSLGFVLRNSYDFPDSSTSILLYKSFVRSKLEFASLIWNPFYVVHVDALERVQRRFLKHLAFREDGVYPNIGTPQNLLLERFSFDCLEKRRQISERLFTFNILHGRYDCSEILAMLPFHTPKLSTRTHLLFYLSSSDTNIHKNSPLMRMCSTINSLKDVDIYTCKKSALKST